jgi:hypothetical protein
VSAVCVVTSRPQSFRFSGFAAKVDDTGGQKLMAIFKPGGT